MKNILLIAIALVTLNAAAQERKKDGAMKAKQEMRQDMTSEEIAQLQTKKMTLHLDLSPAQQTEVEKVLLDEGKERQTKMAKYTSEKEAHAEKTSKDDRFKMQNERLDHQIAMKAKMKTILNAVQYEKFETMQQKRVHKKGDQMKMRHQKN